MRSMSAYLSSSRERYVHEFYRELKSLIDELEMHQPVVIDAVTGILSETHSVKVFV